MSVSTIDFDQLKSHLSPIDAPLSIYIHVPFCLNKCDYCSFLSYQVKEKVDCGDFDKIANNWKDEIINQIENFIPLLLPTSIYTIYIGGGTPSLLEAFHYKEIFKALENCCKKHNIEFMPCEISMEANPSSVSVKKLQDFLEAGFNRITFGVQSFDLKYLKWMGRRGDRYLDFEELKNLVAPLVDENINFGLDLICGFPNQTTRELILDCTKALSLRPKHISLYRLILDEDTPLSKRFNGFTSKELSCLDESELKAGEFLHRSGYNHYEISNYALDGYESKHNLVYWNMDNSLALGEGGVSTLLYDDGKMGAARVTNLSGNKFDLSFIDRDEFRFENMMMGLRTATGINLKKFKMRFGFTPEYFYKEQIMQATTEGLIEQDSTHFKMSKKGFDYLNSFLVKLLP